MDTGFGKWNTRNSCGVVRYRAATGGEVVDCTSPWRAGAVLRAGFFGWAGFVVGAVGLVSAGAGPPTAAGPTAGWSPAVRMCFFCVRGTAAFFFCLSRDLAIEEAPGLPAAGI